MHIENPALRLLTILERGKALPNSALTRGVVSLLLNVSDDEPLLLKRLSMFFELKNEIIQSLKDIDAYDPSMTKHWVMQMNVLMLQFNMNAPWSTNIGIIDDHSLNYIKGHSQLLKAHSSLKEIPSETLAESKSKLQELVQKIQQSDFEQNIKEYLVRSINLVIANIDEYFLTGHAPIIESLNSIYGKAVIDTGFREAVNNSELKQDIWTTLTNMSSAVTVSTGLPQIASSVALFLDSFNS